MSDRIPLHTLKDGPNSKWGPFREELFEFAGSLGKQYHTFGYLHLVMSPEEWNRIHTEVDIHGVRIIVPMPAPFQRPADLPPLANANRRATYQIQLARFNDEVAIVQYIKRFLLLGIGPSNVALIKQPDVGTSNRSCAYIMNFVRPRFSMANSTTIKAWKAQLIEPHSSANTLDSLIAKHKDIHDRLAQAQQPLSEFDRFDHFETATKHSVGITKLIESYKHEEPRLEDQTFLALMDHLIVHESELTTGTMGFSAQANATVTMSQVEALIAQSARGEYARGLADGARGAGSGRHGGRGGRHNSSTPAGRGRGPGVARNYCYLHGYDGHPSSRCYTMAADTVTYSAAMRVAVSHTSPVGGSTYKL